MILTKEVEYRGKMVSVSDLTYGSRKKVDVLCPRCDNVRNVEYRAVSDGKNYKCHSCTLIENNSKNLELGREYGRWTIVSASEKAGMSICICQCGVVRDVDNYSLKAGSSRSCGCLVVDISVQQRVYLDLGSNYGRLETVSHSDRAGHTICKCVCGNVVEVSNQNLERGVTRSCGCYQRELASKRMSKWASGRTGELSPRWKGGVSSERERYMQTKEYKDWRTYIFERDGFTCQKCNQVGYELRAHHILSYALHPDVRVDKSNGITLCDECHREFHGIYGNDNSREQLKEFLKGRSE